MKSVHAEMQAPRGRPRRLCKYLINRVRQPFTQRDEGRLQVRHGQEDWRAKLDGPWLRGTQLFPLLWLSGAAVRRIAPLTQMSGTNVLEDPAFPLHFAARRGKSLLYRRFGKRWLLLGGYPLPDGPLPIQSVSDLSVLRWKMHWLRPGQGSVYLHSPLLEKRAFEPPWTHEGTRLPSTSGGPNTTGFGHRFCLEHQS